MNFQGKKIAYVTREIERALGIDPSPDYHIVSNRTKYGEKVKASFPDYVTLVEPSTEGLLGTTELLNHEETRATLEKLGPSTSILVFKNTLRVENAATAHGWKLINPRSSLSEKVENKISQVRWLDDIGQKYLPPHASKVAKHISWKNDPFIIQWSHGHTGDGTILVKSRDELVALQEKFPERMARLSTYISGPSFTINAVVCGNKTLTGNVSYQITGLQPFTDNEFSTIGNDWGAAAKMLSTNDKEKIAAIVNEIGAKLAGEGWKGLFGIDLIKDSRNGKIYLIEINARQPASSTFESTLQESARQGGATGLTTFEAHLRALLDIPVDQHIVEITDGAQIVQRVTKKVQSVFDDAVSALEKLNFKVLAYENTMPNADLLRVQSEHGIIADHSSLNENGRNILNAIKSSQFNIEV